jgi:CDP-diglyceride synthetase
MEEREPSWDDIPPVWRVLWVAIIVSFLVWLAAYILRDNINKYLIIQTVVLTLTLIAIVWYTFETNKMHREMVRQTTISIMPLFNVAIVIKYGTRNPWDASSRYNVFLQNIGNGVGLNIEIDPLYVKHDLEGQRKLINCGFSG